MAFFRAYVNSKNPDMVTELPEIIVDENPDYETDEELFQ